MAEAWYWARGQERVGPMTLEELVRQLPSAQGERTLVYGPGMGNWVEAAKEPRVAAAMRNAGGGGVALAPVMTHSTAMARSADEIDPEQGAPVGLCPARPFGDAPHEQPAFRVEGQDEGAEHPLPAVGRVPESVGFSADSRPHPSRMRADGRCGGRGRLRAIHLPHLRLPAHAGRSRRIVLGMQLPAEAGGLRPVGTASA